MAGHKWTLCPDDYQASQDADGNLDRRVPIQDCLDCALTRIDRDCPFDWADLKIRIERDVKQSYTPSGMNACKRERWIKLRHDYAVDPFDAYARARGIGSHAGLETDHPDILSEVTVCRYLEVDGVQKPIVTRPDKVYPRLGLIHDDKTKGYIRSDKGQPVPPEIYHRYKVQLSVGAWCWANPAWMAVQDGPKVLSPKAHTVIRGQITFRDGAKQARVWGIPLLEFGALETWMAEQIRVIDRVHEPDSPIPDWLPEGSRGLCSMCSVRDICGVPLDKRPRRPSRALGKSNQK